MYWIITFNFYFEFFLDEMVFPFVEKPGKINNVYALTTGIIKTLKILDIKNILSFNFAYTSPWVYNEIFPYLKFDNRILHVSSFPSPIRTIHSFPIGFKYGSDSTFISLKFTSFVNTFLTNFEFYYLKKGPISIFTDYGSEVEENKFRNYWGFNFDLNLKEKIKIQMRIVNNYFLIGFAYVLNF